MLRIGLTGGIASGKSVIANLFHKLGVKIIDSDEIAKRLTDIQQPAYIQIYKRYGPEILTQAGEINRKKLRQIIFDQLEEKRWLEKVLHPLIIQQIQKEALQAKIYCIIVIPLLVEVRAFHLVDRILVVDASEEDQVKRVMERDKIDRQTALKILQLQANRQERLSLANDVILNNKSFFELENQVKKLHLKYIALSI